MCIVENIPESLQKLGSLGALSFHVLSSPRGPSATPSIPFYVSETKKNLMRLCLGIKEGDIALGSNYGSETLGLSLINVQTRCHDEQPSITATQIWSYSTHTIPQTLENLHIEAVIHSLSWRKKFVVDNTMNEFEHKQ